MSPDGVAWVLNLDAEDELARGRAHTPTDAVRKRVEGLLPRLGESLVKPGDTVAWPAAEPTVPPGTWGRAWSPTRWANSRFRRLGLRAPPAPPPAVLRRVNHRRFAHDLGQALPAAGFVTEAAALVQLLANVAGLEEASVESAWLLKRPLGYAGRGRLRLDAKGPTPTDRAWIDASLRTGDGLQVEPCVTRLLDVAIHGWLDLEGHCTWGEPTVQLLDDAGAWQGSRLARPGELAPDEVATLRSEAAITARALHAAGYFGPFGLDAFRWRDAHGDVHFQPRCELNARYSMGWGVGLGDFRPRAGIP